jgi:ribosome recycling factor
MECRGPRFSELDAQIDAEEATRQRRRDVVRKAKGRGPRLPVAVRKKIACLARELRRQHRKFFIADHKLRDRSAGAN